MIVGCVKEIKILEHRAGLSPESVEELVRNGHEVLVETGTGSAIDAPDEVYQAAGASILPTAEAVFERSEMIVKVKEPQAAERKLLREGQILFTYLHLAPDPEQTKDLISSKAVCIAYETVTEDGGGLPLLRPMSQVAGRMSIQAGAHALQTENGGRGVLLGGVPGVLPAKVVVIGGGVVGFNSAQMAVGLGADVTILDRDANVLRQLAMHFGSSAKTRHSSQASLKEEIARADLVIGGVLVPGGAAPKLITRPDLSLMKPGSVLVDVAIDQGGCFETSRATTHADPTYMVDDIVHYCVANMPGAVARTSTYALNQVTLPHILAIANKGWRKALSGDAHLANGLNVCGGDVTCEAVASALELPFVSTREALT